MVAPCLLRVGIQPSSLNSGKNGRLVYLVAGCNDPSLGCSEILDHSIWVPRSSQHVIRAFWGFRCKGNVHRFVAQPSRREVGRIGLADTSDDKTRREFPGLSLLKVAIVGVLGCQRRDLIPAPGRLIPSACSLN